MSEKPKWTPGPWFVTTVSAYPNGPLRVWAGDKGEHIVADLYGSNRTQNAHLIAAAPQLYEALDRLTGEVRACWGMSEPSLRHEIGNTNYQIVADRIEDALTALSAARGKP